MPFLVLSLLAAGLHPDRLDLGVLLHMDTIRRGHIIDWQDVLFLM
jgi:hypothetical protein